jgi:uncharacterized repeat protein (TIGR01451 family)
MRGSARSGWLAGVMVLALLWAGGTGSAAQSQGSVGIEKSVVGLSGAATPNTAFSYQLTAQCSSLTVACVGATVTDVLPPALEVIASELPASNSSQIVSYNASTRTLKVTFVEPLPPPNPPGSTGLPAGSVRQILVGVRLPADTPLPDGSVITNTGQITADNASPASSSVDVNVSIPRVVTPVATKTWPDSSPVALSGATSKITMGIRNASSTSAQVKELSMRDSSSDTWDDFDLVSLGPVDRFPAGADEVAALVCTQPIDRPCAPDQYKQGPFGPGPKVDLPAGVNPVDVTGVEFVFRNAAGRVLPADPNEGRVSFDVRLRDTVRSSGAPLDPTTTRTGKNCAEPAAKETDTAVGGTAACVSFSILPNAATVKVDKSFFPDQTGSYTPNGVAVAGQSSPVSALTTAKNTSPFAVADLTIVEPSPTAPSDFDKFNADSIRIQFPDGATDVTVTVDCRSGATHTIGPLHPPPTTVELRDTGCPPGGSPRTVTAAFTGTTASGAPSIRPGATASLGLHGTLASDVGTGRLSDCAEGHITGTGGRGAATGTGCADLPVEAPRSTVDGSKAVNAGLTAGQLVPGQPLGFTVKASNSGNLPDREFGVEDPADPAAPGNPFDVVQLTDASLSTSPASLRNDMVIEVFDPATGTWVPYDPAHSGLLSAAHGIRARLVRGVVAPGAQVTLDFSVVVRDNIPIGATLQNCQRTTARTDVGSGSRDVCAPRLTVKAPSAGGAVQKVIAPSSVARHLPGVTPQTTQIRIKAQNTGTIPLNRIVVTDTYAAFFDSVDVTSLDAINFPPGANRVQVDACTTGCQTGTFINGVPTASTRPALPAGVAAADVQGLHFTFTNSSGGYVLTPGGNFPSGAPCPGATICFSVAPRVSPRSDPTTLIPDSLSNTASAAGESQLQPVGTTFPFGDSTAPLSVAKGTTQLAVSKSTSTTLAGPGEPIPFDLTVTNSGTGAVPDLVISEPIPADLVFDQSFTGTDNQPFTITSTVPAGTAAFPSPTFSAERDPTDPNRVGKLRWTFPGFDFLPGSSVKISFRTTLAPGLAAGTRVENSFGASSTDASTQAALSCSPSAGAVTDGAYGGGRYCTAKASVTSRGGSALDAQKWVTGDPTLGFYNTATRAYVKPGDIPCPLLRSDGADYTRYPCIALVLAGQRFRFLLNVTNIGNTPATEVRLVDGLPHLGDTGVKLTNEMRDTQWDPRPRLTDPPSLVSGPLKTTGQYAYTTKLKPCTDELTTPPRKCPAGDWDPGFSTDAEGFRAFVTFPGQLAPGKSFAITVPMIAPVDLKSPPDSLPIAWNSFAHTDFVLKPGDKIPSQLPLVEPPKVGVALPFGTLEIEKQLTGPLAPSAAGTFEASYDCVVTPAAGSPVSVASGHGAFNVDGPLVVPRVPVGAVCSVWETDTGGGASDHTVPENAIKVAIKVERNGSTSVVLVNDFPALPPVPPAPASTPAIDAELTITKTVNATSADVGEPLVYTIAVANRGPATATDVRVTDSSSQDLTVLGASVTQGACSTGRPLVCTLGSLAAGGRATITVEATAGTAGPLRNTATVTAEQVNPASAGATASAFTELRVGPTRLRITKTPSFRHVGAGGGVDYRIRVDTVGSSPAVGVRVCDRVGPYVSIVSAPRARFSAGVPCWAIARLDPGHEAVFTVKVVADNVPIALVASDIATATASNAPGVHAGAELAIAPRPTPAPVTG